MEIKVNDFLEANKLQSFDGLVSKLHIEVKSEDVILHQTSNGLNVMNSPHNNQ